SLETKAKTPLERAEERLRKTRLDDDSSFPAQETISPPQQAQPEPSPKPKPIEQPELPKSTELPPPEQVSPKPLPEKEEVPVTPIKISEQKAKEELKQALEEKPSPEETLPESKKQAPEPSYKKEVKVPAKEEPLEEKEEKVEFLKREGVKTMQKDLKQTREFEAKEERQRITDLQTEPKKIEVEKQTEPKLVEKKPTIQPLPEKDLIPQPPERPSSFKKIIVRVGVFALIVLLVSFTYWFFTQKERSTEEDTTSSIEQDIPQEQEIVEELEITIPQSIIFV
ncbi:unnamed protein product, partial [marine sediment metagenome]